MSDGSTVGVMGLDVRAEYTPRISRGASLAFRQTDRSERRVVVLVLRHLVHLVGLRRHHGGTGATGSDDLDLGNFVDAPGEALLGRVHRHRRDATPGTGTADRDRHSPGVLVDVAHFEGAAVLLDLWHVVTQVVPRSSFEALSAHRIRLFVPKCHKYVF